MIVRVGDGLGALEPSISACGMVRDEAALITAVDDSIVTLLGWRPDQLIGTPSTALIHPNDQASAVSAWFAMIDAPGSTRTWRGRYRTVKGEWHWIEAINTNRLDDHDRPGVYTLMQTTNPDFVSVEEELRAREELITRLSDALPVGIFQVDRDHRVFSSNGRLHQILGAPPSANLASQFAVVLEEDRPHLEAAIESVLSGGDIDDLELRFTSRSPTPTLSRPGCAR